MYWSRKLLKSNARNVLRGSYWRVFAACLVCGLLGAGSSGAVNINLPTQLLELDNIGVMIPTGHLSSLSYGSLLS